MVIRNVIFDFFSLSLISNRKKNLLDSIRSRDTSCIFIIYSDHRFYSFEDRERSHQTRFLFPYAWKRTILLQLRGKSWKPIQSKHRRNNLYLLDVPFRNGIQSGFHLHCFIDKREENIVLGTYNYVPSIPDKFSFPTFNFSLLSIGKKKESISFFQFWKISFPYSSIFVDRHSYRNSKMFKTREHYKFLYIERRVLLCIQYTRVIIVNVNEDVSLVLTFNFKLLSIGE